MAIQHFNSEEEMEDAFEERMADMQEMERLKEEIMEAEFEADEAHQEWLSAKEKVLELEKALDALQQNE